MGPCVGDGHVFGSMEVGGIGFSRWFHGFWSVSIVFQGGFMVFGWFPWFCWLRTPQNGNLVQRSSLGLAGRRPALA